MHLIVIDRVCGAYRALFSTLYRLVTAETRYWRELHAELV